MTTLKQRLIEIAHDLKQEDPVPNRYFEELLGLSSGRITQLFEPGAIAKLGAKSLGRLTRLGYSADWVQDGRLPKMLHKLAEATAPGDGRLPIRRGLFKLSAGVSGYEVEYENGESEPIFMARRWFEHNNYNPERLIALKVNGRSMEPKMHDGDLVIVNTDSAIPKDGVVFAVNYEGEMVIKRMKRDAGQWFITSDNPDKTRYGDKVCAEACFLLGEVVYLQTETI